METIRENSSIKRALAAAVGSAASFLAVRVLAEEEETLHSPPGDENPGMDVSQLYAVRKKARLNRSEHPREFDPAVASSFVTGSPSRPRVVKQRVHRLPRDMTGQDIIMQQWTEADWLANVRVSKHLFMWLVDELDSDLVERCSSGGKPARPKWSQLASVLAWLGGARPQDIQEIWGMRRTCFRRYKRLVISAIIRKFRDEYVKFPSTEDELQKQSASFAQWFKYPGVVGVVDGLIVPVKLPDHALATSMWCERKSVYGYNIQAVCNANCEFTFFAASHYASVHDGRAFKESTLWNSLEQGLLIPPEQRKGVYFLLGDNAYSLRSFLLHPWKGRPTAGTRADSFNYFLSAARCTIERAFGQLVLTFPILKNGMDVRDTESALQIIQCCCLLHNIRKRWNEVNCTTPFPTTQPLNTNEILHTEEQAISYIRQMGDDEPGERLQTDRHIHNMQDVRIAVQLRRRIAYWFNDHGYCRHGARIDFITPCPDESAEAHDGLI